jgi:hypothetical protein
VLLPGCDIFIGTNSYYQGCVQRPFAECAERDGSNTQLALRTGGKWEIYVRVYQNEFEIKDKTNTNNPLHI